MAGSVLQLEGLTCCTCFALDMRRWRRCTHVAWRAAGQSGEAYLGSGPIPLAKDSDAADFRHGCVCVCICGLNVASCRVAVPMHFLWMHNHAQYRQMVSRWLECHRMGHAQGAGNGML